MAFWFLKQQWMVPYKMRLQCQWKLPVSSLPHHRPNTTKFSRMCNCILRKSTVFKTTLRLWEDIWVLQKCCNPELADLSITSAKLEIRGIWWFRFASRIFVAGNNHCSLKNCSKSYYNFLLVMFRKDFTITSMIIFKVLPLIVSSHLFLFQRYRQF